MERLPWLLVGCGLMGARHVRGYAELERMAPGHLHLAAVCDRDEGLARQLADEAAELLGHRPEVFTDLEAAVRVPGLVAADLVTPNRTHDELAVALMEAGLHLLTEKPLAVTIARGRRILAAAARTGRVLAVAENNRRDPMNRLLRQVVQSGLLGRLNFVEQCSVSTGGQVVGTPWRHRASMGGLALDVWIHLAYILEFLAGPIEQVYAQTSLIEAERVWKRTDGAEELVACDAPDAMLATLTFANGALGSWTTHMAARQWGRNERVLMGDRATAIASPDRSGKPVVLLADGQQWTDEALLELVPSFRLNAVEAALFGGARIGRYEYEWPVTDRKLIAAEVADFVAAIREQRPPEVPGEVGLRSVALIYALLESARRGQPVRIEEVVRGEVAVAQDEVETANSGVGA